MVALISNSTKGFFVIKPTGEKWKNWKKIQSRSLKRKGMPVPKDWAEYWANLHGVQYTKDTLKHGRSEETIQEQFRLLQLECSRLKKQAVSQSVIREEILNIKHAKPPIPNWLIRDSRTTNKCVGVPTLLASDWHWGERVAPDQVAGVNSYDMTIARVRAKRLIENTVDLLKNHMVNPDYPGVVFALAGDMFSGNIHQELLETNELPIMPTFLDLYGVLVWCIQELKRNFGSVFIPCVSGNHSRNTQKITSKNRNFLSFDWLLYQMLDKYFENDDKIVFLIPDSADAVYKIYDYTYCLTHGDSFRSGDSMIGPLGPIIRGDHKKRGRNSQVGQAYTTLLLGHFHQLMQTQRVITNGSLIGYNEYAYSNNFSYEPPRQALWITNERHGITFQMPVLVEDTPKQPQYSWVSWEKR